jgi:hypothetical protein
MRKVYDFKMPKLDVKQKLILIAINIVAFVTILFNGGNTLFGWMWNPYLMSVLLVLASLWLVSQGGWKAIQKLSSSARHPEGLLHVISFGVGLVLLFIGIASLPFIGNMINISNYTVPVAIMLIAGAILSVLEMFF